MTTLTLIPETIYDSESTVTGTAQKAASYYRGKSLQTVTYDLAGVTANIEIQATLVTAPAADEWFLVDTLIADNTTEASYLNYSGNFVWLRANVTDFAQGTINSIEMSY